MKTTIKFLVVIAALLGVILIGIGLILIYAPEILINIIRLALIVLCIGSGLIFIILSAVFWSKQNHT